MIGRTVALVCFAFVCFALVRLGLASAPTPGSVDLPLARTPTQEAPGATLSPDVAELPAASPPVPTPPAEDPDFPEPEELQPAIAFWKRVYLEVTTDAGFLHDSRRLGVVYEVVRFDGVKSERARRRLVKRRRSHWRAVLDRLRRGRAPRDEAERRAVHSMERALGRLPTPRDWAIAARRVRFQLGQRDVFRAGLIRSGSWQEQMRTVFREAGLPEDLAYLPHVESSFNPAAYSKHGAAGVWQFMRSTGRHYLKIDYVVDERLDPMAATRAAAKLLAKNYEALKSWPLAITAYNHGRSGMARAVRRLKTDAIEVIVDRYKSRRFGFASRNFYAQFLAVRSILRSYESYFGPVQRDSPEAVDQVALPFFADVASLDRHLGIAPGVIKHYNPSLRRPVYRGQKRIPRGFTLRLPSGTVLPDAETWLARVPQGERHARQHRSSYYQVRRGDTLSKIARRHRTTVGALASYNNLPSRHRIYSGQVLQIPNGRVARPAPSLVRSARAASARAAPPARIDPAPATPPAISEDSPWRRVDDVWITVDDNETLAHFAEWLELPVASLRQQNGASRGQQLRFGQRFRLEFSRVEPTTFLERRMEFHKGIEEDFFGSYRVAGTVDHHMARGESLWELARKTYSVPIWLIHRYNPGVDFKRLVPGALLKIPIVERLAPA